MPLVKNTLAQALEDIYNRRPGSVAEAGADWGQAYVSYASAATSSTGGLPVTAMAGLSPLTAAFTAAFGTQTSAGAASAIAQGVLTFWQSIAWVGPAYAGVTMVPGNFSLVGALTTVFADVDQKTAGDKARAVADAFDAGAKQVMVNDILLAPPFTPKPGPIQ